MYELDQSHSFGYFNLDGLSNVDKCLSLKKQIYVERPRIMLGIPDII